jgi:hypothetical protein
MTSASGSRRRSAVRAKRERIVGEVVEARVAPARRGRVACESALGLHERVQRCGRRGAENAGKAAMAHNAVARPRADKVLEFELPTIQYPVAPSVRSVVDPIEDGAMSLGLGGPVGRREPRAVLRCPVCL